MLTAGKILAQLNDLPGSAAAMDSSYKVVGRLYKKANYALKTYGKDKFYYIPVHTVAIAAEKNFNLLTNNSSTEVLDIIPMQINDVSKQYFNDLKTQHDYSLIENIVELHRKAAVLGGNSDIHDLYEKLSKVVRFTVIL